MALKAKQRLGHFRPVATLSVAALLALIVNFSLTGEATAAEAPKSGGGSNLDDVGKKLANPLADLWALNFNSFVPGFFDGDVNKVDVCNVIPAMKAGKICDMAGITDGNWSPVDGHTMQSRMDENIHVLGDSSAQGDMPKSGFSANSQAKVAAMAIRGTLTGSRVFPAKYSNTCWSLIDTDDGVKVGAAYEPTEEKIASVQQLADAIDGDLKPRSQPQRLDRGAWLIDRLRCAIQKRSATVIS